MKIKEFCNIVDKHMENSKDQTQWRLDTEGLAREIINIIDKEKAKAEKLEKVIADIELELKAILPNYYAMQRIIDKNKEA